MHSACSLKCEPYSRIYPRSSYLVILSDYDELFSTLTKMITPGSETRRSPSSGALMDCFPVLAAIQVTCGLDVSHTRFIDSGRASKDLPVVSDISVYTLTRGLDTQRYSSAINSVFQFSGSYDRENTVLSQLRWWSRWGGRGELGC